MRVQVLARVDAQPKEVSVEWGELVDTLTNVEPTAQAKADLAGWCPAALRHPWRNEKNTEHVSCLALDFDDVTEEQWKGVQDSLGGFAWLYHSTYSHNPAVGKLRYRAVVQLSRPVQTAEWRRFFYAVAKELGAAQDMKCSDPCRFFYGAYCPEGGPAPESGSFPGEPMPVDEILLLAPASGDPTKPRVLSERALTHAELAAVVPKALRKIENDTVRGGWEGVVRALDGQAYAPTGQRDNTLLAMSGVLSKAFPNTSAAAIVDPIRVALEEAYEDMRSAVLLEAKLARDLEKLQDERAKAVAAQMTQAGREVPYSEGEIATWCKQLGVPDGEALSRQLLIVHGSDHYLFWEGRYVWVGSAERGEHTIQARLAAAAGVLPISLGEETPRGWVTKTGKRLARDYGRTVFKVVKDLRLQHSYVSGDTFHFAICPRDPELVSAHSPGVDLWLRSWGHPELLDWLASAPRLEKATAALVLDGQRGTGKTQLAKGVARVWNARPTPMHSLNAAFNDALSKCPVVYAEESIPWEFRRDVGLLKALITEDNQQLREKYQSTAELHGSVRLILARNDHRLFEAGEALSQSTVDALTDRLLYVNTGYVEAPYFQSDEIARHILWLMENHAVPPSRRGGLWVTGRPSRLHYRMRAFTSKTSASVCEWLLNFLEHPTFTGDTGMEGFRLDSQGMAVSPRLVHSKWEQCAGKEIRQPTRAQIADALAGMSFRRGELFVVDLNVLAEYADSTLNKNRTVTALQSAVEHAGRKLTKEAN